MKEDNDVTELLGDLFSCMGAMGGLMGDGVSVFRTLGWLLLRILFLPLTWPLKAFIFFFRRRSLQGKLVWKSLIFSLLGALLILLAILSPLATPFLMMLSILCMAGYMRSVAFARNVHFRQNSTHLSKWGTRLM